MGHEVQAASEQKGSQGALNSGHAQCLEEGKTPLGTSAILPWGKIPSGPQCY